ncbi:MAG: hypothetical protein ABI600_21140 [Luteolibacter sp.]
MIASGGTVKITQGWQTYSAHLDLCEVQVERGDGLRIQFPD